MRNSEKQSASAKATKHESAPIRLPALVVPPMTLAEAALRVQLPATLPSHGLGPTVGPMGAPPPRVSIAAVRPPLKPSQLPSITVDSSKLHLYVPTATVDEEAAKHEANEEARITAAAATLEQKQTEEARRLASMMPEGPKFVMSLCRDLQGNIWAGSEGEGVCCYEAATGRWRQYTTKDGLGQRQRLRGRLRPPGTHLGGAPESWRQRLQRREVAELRSGWRIEQS